MKELLVKITYSMIMQDSFFKCSWRHQHCSVDWIVCMNFHTVHYIHAYNVNTVVHFAYYLIKKLTSGMKEASRYNKTIILLHGEVSPRTHKQWILDLTFVVWKLLKIYVKFTKLQKYLRFSTKKHVVHADATNSQLNNLKYLKKIQDIFCLQNSTNQEFIWYMIRIHSDSLKFEIIK